MAEKRRILDVDSPPWDNGQKSRAFDSDVFSRMKDKLRELESTPNGQRMKSVNPAIFTNMMDKLNEMESVHSLKTVDSRLLENMMAKVKDLENTLYPVSSVNAGGDADLEDDDDDDVRSRPEVVTVPVYDGYISNGGGGGDEDVKPLLMPPPPPPSLTSSPTVPVKQESAGAGVELKPFSGNAGEFFDVLLCYDAVAMVFKCPFKCSTASATPKELRTHAEQNHEVKFPHTCAKCGAGFQSTSSFSFHIRACGFATKALPSAAHAAAAAAAAFAMPTGPMPVPILRNGGRCCPVLNYQDWWLCGICASVYLDRHSFRAHIFNDHPSMCMVCRVDVQCDVAQHLAVSHPSLMFPNTPPDVSVLAIVSAPPFCPVCLADFGHWSEVEAHRMTCNPQEVAQNRQEAAKEACLGKIACDLCKFSVGPEGIQAHFASYHSRTCFVCLARFWDASEMAAHMYKHNEWINSAFGGLEYYWQSAESGVKPFCHMCSSKTGQEQTEERFFVSEFNGNDELAYFDSWVDVEGHYRYEHAPYFEPPMHVEDYWTCHPGSWNRKN